MTTYFDILGINKNTPLADVKRRYKLLSSRCHPDKGGSKSIMQLIGQAYEKVLSGHGHEEAVQVVYLKSNKQAEVWKKKCQHLEEINQSLQRQNDELERKLKTAQEKQKEQEKASPSDDDNNYKQMMEEEMQTLRRENRRLQSKVDSLRREKRSDSKEVMKPELSGQLVVASQKLTPAVANQIKAIGRSRIWGRLAMLGVPVGLVWLAMGPGKEPLVSVWNNINPPPQTMSKPTMRLLHHDPAVSEEEANKQVVSTDNTQSAEKKIIPVIQLSGEVGIWQLKKFVNTPSYYISVRSEKGSYVIKSCNSDFQYYKNTLQRSGRMAANLIYTRDERHFEIYDIPYGNGSFAHNWAKSKSLLINNEYFPNKNFAASYSNLQQHCQ
ncbi:DnaJ domain-containing protein [Photobacterium rosenbergii]|uniref:DnaJ domain-containing protein n=1 Tax=Photobacterium rosenbergii TaxID=294936 RepID=A0ABU3ZES5_9GAMM|nr:DnaJ domain-containing protein [Photobacterium rosenbergii]MDV5168599.1 DnaJ domain-containing protein [Photobacterium rosenbergii]